MALTENELVILSLRQSKDFSKAIRRYLYKIGQQRNWTEEEKELYHLTHEIHIRTNDAILILEDETREER